MRGIKFLLRIITIAFSVILVLVFGIILICYFFVPIETIMNNLINFDLKLRNINNSHVVLNKVTKNKILAENIHLGDPKYFAIKTLEIDYTFNHVFEWRINKIKIQGLTLKDSDLTHHKLTFGNLDKLLRPTSVPYTSIHLWHRIDAISVIDAHIIADINQKRLNIPFEVDINLANQSLLLKAENVHAVLNNLKTPSFRLVSMESRFSGVCPISWSDAGLNMRGGSIYTTAPGKIKLVPKSLSAESNNQLYDIFGDLEYEKISANLEIENVKDIKAAVVINNAYNPSYLGGTVLNLQIDLSVRLSDIIESLLAIYDPRFKHD